MKKLDKLVAKKRARDKIDDVGDAIVQGLQSMNYVRREPLHIPHFFVSSAAAATLLHLVGTWGTQAGVRAVATVATSASPPPAGPVLLPDTTSGWMAEAALTGLTIVPEVVLLHNLALGCDVGTVLDILRPDAIDAYVACIEERELQLALQLNAAEKVRETTLVVPLYFLHVPMVDDGSQRLAPVMPGLTRLFDAMASQASNSVCWNTSRLCRLIRNTDSSLVVGPSCVEEGASHSSGPSIKEAPSATSVVLGAGVLVHCLQGISRSVAVVLWYLVNALVTCGGRCATSGEMVGVKQLLEWTRQARPCACPNLCFAAELNSMEARLQRSTRSSHKADAVLL